jgi:hypothetical protein
VTRSRQSGLALHVPAGLGPAGRPARCRVAVSPGHLSRAREPIPFVHHIVDEFAAHNDSDQFRAGLDPPCSTACDTKSKPETRRPSGRARPVAPASELPGSCSAGANRPVRVVAECTASTPGLSIRSAGAGWYRFRSGRGFDGVHDRARVGRNVCARVHSQLIEDRVVLRQEALDAEQFLDTGQGVV